MNCSVPNLLQFIFQLAFFLCPRSDCIYHLSTEVAELEANLPSKYPPKVAQP